MAKPIDTSLLESLITNGADVNHTDKDGNGALHIISRNPRQVAVAKFLPSLGADIYATNCKGDTVFDEVARGILVPRQTVDGKIEQVSRGQDTDKVMSVLEEAASGGVMMVKQNAEGKTPPRMARDKKSVAGTGIQTATSKGSCSERKALKEWWARRGYLGLSAFFLL